MTTRLVERPIRFGSLRRIGVSVSIASLLLVAATSFVIWRSGGGLWRYPPEIRPVLETMNYNPRMMPAWTAGSIKKRVSTPMQRRCKVGTTVVWGDYTGHDFTPVFGKMTGRYLNSPATGACRSLEMRHSYRFARRATSRTLNEIERAKPRRVILFAVWMRYKPDFAALEATLRRLKAVVDDVILLGPSPSFSPNLPEQAYQDWLSHRALPERLIPCRKIIGNGCIVAFGRQREREPGSSRCTTLMCNQEGCLNSYPDRKVRPAKLGLWPPDHKRRAFRCRSDRLK